MPTPTDMLPSSGPSTNSPKVEDGKLVARKAISTAFQAQQIGDSLVQADVGRDQRRAELQRALNGASPYSSRTLRDKNQAHRFNVSVGYLEGACGRAYSPYLDMGLDEEFVARIDADLDETKKNIIRDEFVKTIQRWGLWSTNYNGLVRETVDFGYCTAVFPDPESPWWQVARQREGLAPARSPAVASKLDLYVWKRSYLIHELYDHVSDEEAAKIAGWQLENVWNALSAAVPDSYIKNRLMGGRQIYEEAIRAAALAMSYDQGAKVIETYHVFCRELNGKVSQWIVLNTSGSTTSQNAEAAPDILLFYQSEQFPSMDEVVIRFDLEYGDGYWHGSKGLAQKLYGVHKAHDRLINSGLDQTFRGGLGVLKSNSQKGHEALNLQVTSDFVVLSPDTDAIPGVKMPTISPEFFSMDAALLATAVQRGGDVAPEAMGIERSQKTATQSSIDQNQKQVITKANLKRWVSPLSSVINKMLRRLLKAELGQDGQFTGNPDAVAFVTAIMSKGITQEDITKIRRAEVYHSVEDVFGETKQNVSYISDKYRNDPDIARLELKKREVGIWLGPQASLELVPGDADQLDQLHASRQQSLEISSILDGLQVLVAPDDLHPAHVTQIAGYLKDLAQRLVQGDTTGKRMPSPFDLANIEKHAEEHIAMQGSVKGQRDSARQLEMVMKAAMTGLTQAMQINQQKHQQAAIKGAELALAETAPGNVITPTSSNGQPSPSPSQPALPAEVMAA